MQNNEFDEWLKRHFSAFPSLREWVHRNPDCLDPWRECLADVVLADALEATRLLNIGDEEAPKGYGDHARVVRRIARHLAFDRRPVETEATYVNGERAYRCGTCLDSGVVEVANIWRAKVESSVSRPLRAFWAGETDYLPACVVGCDCQASRPAGLQQLDRERMFLIDRSETKEAAADRFRQWWEEGHRFGRQREFDEWNEGARA